MAYIGAGITRFNTADELTVTGDAQIDTTTLVVDSTNNRVGVGTASPATALDVTGTVAADGLTMDSSANSAYSAVFGANRTGAGTALGLIKGSWNGTTVAQINLLAGSDTTNKDDGRIQLRTSNSGGSVLNRFQIDENGDTSFYADDGSTQGLFWDASTQRLGLGTTSPSTNLEINGGANNNIVRIVSTDANANIEFADNTTTSGLSIGANGNNMKFGINGTEAMRISAGSTIFKAPDGGSRYLFGGTGNSDNAELSLYNSSDAQKVRIGAGVDSFFNGGNLLVGKTSASVTTVGAELRPDGAIIGVRDGDLVALLNRTSSDGEIISLRKDNSVVGSIQTKDSRLFISGSQGSTPAGIYFGGGGDILPASTTNAVDNSISLGGTGHRWKNLFLSGGAYIGGTGSANYLDDYEEGTFTPRFQQGITTPGYATQIGTYIKIGRQVICSIYLRVNSGTANNGHIYIGGLPFTVTNDIDHTFGAFFTYNGGFWNPDANVQWLAFQNTTNMGFYKQSNGGAIVGNATGVATNLNADCRLVAIYRTD